MYKDCCVQPRQIYASTLTRRERRWRRRRGRNMMSVALVAAVTVAAALTVLATLAPGLLLRFYAEKLNAAGKSGELTRDKIKRLIEHARGAKRRVRKADVRGVAWPPIEDLIPLEREASTINQHEHRVIPGGLQTEAYARALLEGGGVVTNVDEQVRIRRSRGALLESDKRPEYWLVLGESALHLEIGSHEIMREQLQHLIEMSKQPRMTIQIIPNSYGAYPSLTSAFLQLQFEIAPDFGIVYIDYLTGSKYIDQPPEVKQYDRAFKHLIRVAKDESESLRILETVIKDKYGS